MTHGALHTTSGGYTPSMRAKFQSTFSSIAGMNTAIAKDNGNVKTNINTNVNGNEKKGNSVNTDNINNNNNGKEKQREIQDEKVIKSAYFGND